MSGGTLHVTDPSNASRTLLFDTSTSNADEALLALFNVPAEVLPEIVDIRGDRPIRSPRSSARADPDRRASRPVGGDPFGQVCVPGNRPRTPMERDVSDLNTAGRGGVAQTACSQRSAGVAGRTRYLLKAGFCCWCIRSDGLGFIRTAQKSRKACGERARQWTGRRCRPLPVFGCATLGSHAWNADGMTRGNDGRAFARAALESALQTVDPVEAMVATADSRSPNCGWMAVRRETIC